MTEYGKQHTYGRAMMLVYGICYSEGSENLGIRLAYFLRQLGHPVELKFKTNFKKQFKKLRDEDITSIYTIHDENRVEWYDINLISVVSTIEEVFQYHNWVNDDLDELPEPRSELLLVNRELPR